MHVGTGFKKQKGPPATAEKYSVSYKVQGIRPVKENRRSASASPLQGGVRQGSRSPLPPHLTQASPPRVCGRVRAKARGRMLRPFTRPPRATDGCAALSRYSSETFVRYRRLRPALPAECSALARLSPRSLRRAAAGASNGRSQNREPIDRSI